MKRTAVTSPQKINSYLGTVAMLCLKGISVDDAVSLAGITKEQYYHWQTKYRGMADDQIKRIQDLETQTLCLRQHLAKFYGANIQLKAACEFEETPDVRNMEWIVAR